MDPMPLQQEQHKPPEKQEQQSQQPTATTQPEIKLKESDTNMQEQDTVVTETMLTCEISKFRKHLMKKLGSAAAFLFLEGGASLVYDRLSDESKKDASAIKVALKKAFGPDPAEAYALFIGAKWACEPPEEYHQKHCRLMEDAGIKGGEVLRAQYCHGLPLEVKSVLHTMANTDASTETLLDVSRMLLREYGKRCKNEGTSSDDAKACEKALRDLAISQMTRVKQQQEAKVAAQTANKAVLLVAPPAKQAANPTRIQKKIYSSGK